MIRNNSRKTILLVFISLLSFLLCSGCTDPQVADLNTDKIIDQKETDKNTNEANKSNHQEKTTNKNSTAQMSKTPNYIVLDGCLLGSYENSKWNSLETHEHSKNLNMVSDIDCVKSDRSITIDELINRYYYVYNQNGFLDKSNDFLDHEFVEEYLNTEWALTFLRYHFKQNQNPIPDAILGLTQQNINPIPKNGICHIKPTKKHIEAVQTVLNNYELTSTNVNITDIMTIDMDNDNTVEELILAQTPFTDESYADLRAEDRFIDGKGVYSIALLIKNDKVIPIYYQGYALSELEYNSNDTSIPFGIDSQFRIKILGFFDLNGDGLVEICLQNVVWDIPEIRVYSFDDESNVTEVLYGNYAW